MTPDEACPFCSEPAIRQTIQGVAFRCGTLGPDINGEYSTGHTCDIATYNRLLAEKETEVERLRAELAIADDTLTSVWEMAPEEFGQKKKAAEEVAKALHEIFNEEPTVCYWVNAEKQRSPPADIRSTLKYVDELEAEVEQLRADNAELRLYLDTLQMHVQAQEVEENR